MAVLKEGAAADHGQRLESAAAVAAAYDDDMCPFQQCNQLEHSLDEMHSRSSFLSNYSLPGRPDVMMSEGARIRDIVREDVDATDLETVAPRLWMLSTPSSSNISALHRQRVKGREIIVTEEPRLHLVWIHNRIFIKPLPRYLLAAAFWRCGDYFAEADANIDSNADANEDSNEDSNAEAEEKERGRCVFLRRAALGYLRSYTHLIRHESDLRIAQREELQLVPSDVDWPTFCRFRADLQQRIDDVDVSPRYMYGEVRLSRLNLYAPFLLHRFYYQQIHGQYGDFFARIFAPILFVFALITTVLNSMQVVLAVEQVDSQRWIAVWQVSRYFGLISLLSAVLISAAIFGLWIWMILDEWVFSLGHYLKRKKRRSRGTTATKLA